MSGPNIFETFKHIETLSTSLAELDMLMYNIVKKPEESSQLCVTIQCACMY